MPRVLRIGNKLWSLRHRIEIFDDAGTVIYSCSRASLFSRSFVVIAEQTEVARIRRKLLSWTPTWLVEGKAGDFAIRTRVFSLRRVYDVKGGPFHGAQVRCNLWDVKFIIALGETLVARANKQLIGLRDTHAIRGRARRRCIGAILGRRNDRHSLAQQAEEGRRRRRAE